MGSLPQVMVAFGHIVTGVMRLARDANLAAMGRRHAAHPHEAVAPVLSPVRTE